jgi:hypothetical protein
MDEALAKRDARNLLHRAPRPDYAGEPSAKDSKSEVGSEYAFEIFPNPIHCIGEERPAAPRKLLGQITNELRPVSAAIPH